MLDHSITTSGVLMISRLPNLFIGTPRICHFISSWIVLMVRSFSKMIPSVKFAEDKVLVYVILREKNVKLMQL